MKYRATLCGAPDREKPLQMHSNHMATVDGWAKTVLDGAPDDAWVKVEEMKYEFVRDIKHD